MESSTSFIKLAQALLRAQRKIENAIKDSKNPAYKSKYAGLAEVMYACKGCLNDEGIVVTQMVQSSADGDFLETIFIHADSGEYMSSKMRLEIQGVQKGMQALGSAISYARRYTLQSQAFITAEDDDGHASSRKEEPPKEEEPPKKEEQPHFTAPTPPVQSVSHKMVTAYEALGITRQRINKALGHDINNASGGDIENLRQTYVTIKSEGKPEFFEKYMQFIK
jgi:hypothetical protein